MAYYVELTERENLPKGRDWMFLEESSGHVRLVIAWDSKPFVLSEAAIAGIAEALARQNYLTPSMVKAS